MRLAGLQKFMVILLLLAFNCQSSFAVAQICPMQFQNTAPPAYSAHSADMNHSMESMQDMGMTDHLTMDHSSHSHSEDKKPPCCKQLGHCLQGGCTAIGFSSQFGELPPELTSSAVYSYSRPKPFPLFASLFRPPIISSI